jgi:hypothetical protein
MAWRGTARASVLSPAKPEADGAAMNLNSPPSWVIVAVLVVVLIIVIGLVSREMRRRQSARLQRRFGPEYARTVTQRGDRSKAEAELLAREKRVEKLKLMPLSPEDQARFSEAWRTLQTRFVDNPRGVVVDADRLVRDLMTKRGYPMGDFEHRAADISVDHPKVVDAYRSARAIAARDERGEASTEELRKAVVYYRTLFDDLLEVPQRKESSPANNEVVHS